VPTAIAARIRTRGVHDFFGASLAIAGALAYLGVGWQHSTLLAIVLVLQAGLGTYLLRCMIKGPTWTLLDLMGPGLIVGGAASIAIFQMVGRGRVGALVVVLAGTLGTAALTKSGTRESNPKSQSLQWIQLLSATAFILSSEFAWLVVPALGLFASNLLLTHYRSHPRHRKVVVFACLTVVLFTSIRLRTSWWWVVTDDYKFFEVLARHITDSGPLKPWGSISFASYHWLSYGWSGLLSLTSGSSAPLVTLTRVMPLVYSLALASSILLVATRLQRNNDLSRGAVTAVWAVLAVTRLDWSGTSTAGVFAVLAAFLGTLTVVLSNDMAEWRRLALYALFGSITLLTKFPSVLMFGPVLIAAETHLYRQRHGRSGLLIPTLVVIGGCIVAIAAVPPLSLLLGGFYVATPNPELGELATRGVYFAFAGVLIRSAWLLVDLSVVAILQRQLRSTPEVELEDFFLSLIPMFFLGVGFDVLVTGNANTSQYFSVPSYFLASIGLLVFIPRLTKSGLKKPNATQLQLFALILTVLLALQTSVKIFDLGNWFRYSTIVEAVADYRLHLGILLSMTMIVMMIKRYPLTRNLTPIFALVLVLPILRVVESTSAQLIQMQREPAATRSALATYLGSPDDEAVGLWIRENTDAGSLIATNSLLKVGPEDAFDDDYSLAMWSDREFLVIGPRFASATKTAKYEIDLCLRFGSEPTTKDLETLTDLGVRWFVIDLAVTDHRDWDEYGAVVFKTDSLWILRLYELVAS